MSALHESVYKKAKPQRVKTKLKLGHIMQVQGKKSPINSQGGKVNLRNTISFQTNC